MMAMSVESVCIKDPRLCAVAKCWTVGNPFPLYYTARDNKMHAVLKKFTDVWDKAGNKEVDYCSDVNYDGTANSGIAQLDNHKCKTFLFGSGGYLDDASKYGFIGLEAYNSFISCDDRDANNDRFSDPFDYKIMLAETTNVVLRLTNLHEHALTYDYDWFLFSPKSWGKKADRTITIVADGDAMVNKFQKIAMSCEIYGTEGGSAGYTCMEIHHVLNNINNNVFTLDGVTFTDISGKLNEIKAAWNAVEQAFIDHGIGTKAKYFTQAKSWLETESNLRREYKNRKLNQMRSI